MRTAPKGLEGANPTEGSPPSALPDLVKARVQARTLWVLEPSSGYGTRPALVP